MFLSIILPVYQVEKYIIECLESIFKIQDIDYEVIIVNDGSTDKSIEYAEKYCSSKVNVKFIHQKNKGLSDARNVGLEVACGKYVWFVDSDDKVSPKGIKKLLSIANNEDILIGNFYKFYDHQAPTLNNHSFRSQLIISGREALKKYYLKYIYTVVWRCVYRREFLIRNKLRFLSGVTYEDVEWSPRVLYLAKSVLYTNIPLYYYRKRDNSIVTSKFNLKKLEDILRVSNSLERFMATYNLADCEKRILDDSSCYFLLLAYYNTKKYKIPYNYQQILNIIRNKDHKGVRYRLLMVLQVITPSLFNFLLNKKFSKL